MSSIFRRLAVIESEEFRRVLQLPLREREDVEALRDQMTAVLKTRAGTMRLKPIQALALRDIGMLGGLFGPIRVGGGKTLISLLAAHVLGTINAVLLLPAHLVERTKADMRELQKHWLISAPRMISYQMLGRASASRELEKYRPTVIISDECFVAGTRVRTPQGSACIESLRPGDEVISFTEDAGFHACKVTDAWSGESDDIVEVQFNGSHGYTCTAGHLFLTRNGWKAAGNLVVGDEVVRDVRSGEGSSLSDRSCEHGNEDGGRSRWPLSRHNRETEDRCREGCPSGKQGVARVSRIERAGVGEPAASRRVYNLHIAGPETYVLSGGEVVHNCHKLKNRKAAVTRRVSRYMEDHPETKFIAISGTIMKSSIRDFAHILTWCLKDSAPIPNRYVDVEQWADALDERLANPFNRLAPGPLLKFATAEDWSVSENDETRTARRGFRRRLIDSPGVVATQNEQVDCKLQIRALEYDVADVTEANFEKLRQTWTTPDDWPLSMATQVWRVASELAIGMHYIWSPRPPDAWINARRGWATLVRTVLKTSDTLDSELQVRQAVQRGDIRSVTVDRENKNAKQVLDAWKAQEPTFIINSKPVWHDDSALKTCAKWMRENRGIVWTNHAFFAKELAKRTGAAYFGQQGNDAKGRRIDDIGAVNETTDPLGVIASIPANGTGRNLQTTFSKNLVTSCVPGSDGLEQLLGRTHRDGQVSNIVTVDILMGCREHFSAWQSALAGAQATLEITGASQKVLDCDVIGFPDEEEIAERSEPRWGNVEEIDIEEAILSVLED